MTHRCELSVSTLTAEKLHKLYQGTFPFSFNTQVAVIFQISSVLAAEDTVVDTLTQRFLPSESTDCDGETALMGILLEERPLGEPVDSHLPKTA